MDFNFRNFVEGKKQLDTALAAAMEKSTLLEALSWLSVWDTERAIAQAKTNEWQSWETTSLFLFTHLTKQWNDRERQREMLRLVESHGGQLTE